MNIFISIYKKALKHSFKNDLHINNIRIHINLHKNWFINKCARNLKAKIPEFHSFFVRCRRTYVINNKIQKVILNSRYDFKRLEDF